MTTVTLGLAVSVAFAAPASAQLNVSSAPINIAPTTVQDIAYDPAHDAYLYVGNITPFPSPPATGGVFINAATRVASSPFLIHANANGALGISAVYSPDVSDGAGGLGGFVVMWFEQLVPGFNGPLQTQVVAYPGRLVGPRQTIVSSANQIWRVSGAYSPLDRVFLFSWGDWSNSATQSVRLDLNAQPLGPLTPIAPPAFSGCFELFYDCMDVTAVWNPATNEFGVAYHDGATVTVARVAGNGTVVQRTVVVNQGARSTMDVDLASGNYIIGWAKTAVGFDNSMNVAEVSGRGAVLRTTTISGVASNTQGIAVSYSPVSHTFLLAGSPLNVTELDYYGSQIGPAVDAGGFSFLPRIVSRHIAPDWALVTSGVVRIVTTSSLSCGTVDPFAALGGGTCFNGGWYPPSAPPAPTPSPTPSPSPSPGGCATPDPFTAFGGGSCVNGGWYPPGAGTPPPSPPPASPPPSVPGGCATPDPFIAFGGGVCFNGGWYFRS